VGDARTFRRGRAGACWVCAVESWLLGGLKIEKRDKKGGAGRGGKVQGGGADGGGGGRGGRG